jgi:iron complex outermembrane receptor protein
MPLLSARLAAVTTASLTALALSLPALAQAPASEDGLDQIIVTGIRAKDRTVLDSPVPVDVLSAAAIERAGGIGGDVTSALQTLAPSFNVQRQSQSGPADHVRAAQLRGMSPDQTLVLFNGKRRHVTAVVNLESKLGRGTNPVDLNSIPVNAIGRIEVLRDGAGAQYGSDAIAGVINVILDNARTGGEVSASYGFHLTDFEPTDDGITDGETLNIAGKASLPLGADGFIRFGVDYTNRNPTVRGGLGALFGDAFGGFPAARTPRNVALLTQVNYKPGDGAVDSLSAWYNAEVALGEARLYSFTTVNSRDTTGVGFFRFPDSSDNVLALFPQGFLPTSTGDTLDIATTFGARGQLAGWDVDGSVGYGRNRFDFGLRNSVNVALGASSPTQFFLGRYTFDQWLVNLDASREFGAVLVAAGVEYRREGFSTGAGDRASFEPGGGSVAYRGLRPTDVADVNRDVIGVYVDLSGTLSERFFWNIAGRFENYSDFGSRVTGKAAGRYELADGFALRASVSNSVRAPALAQGSFRQSVTTFAAGSNIPQLVGTVPVTDPVARELGARDLEPEEALNLSLGFTAQTGNGFTFSFDAFQINVDDRITLSENIAGPNGTNVNFFTNAADTRTRGVEAVATYTTPLAGGQFDLSAALSYAKTKIRAINVPAAQFNVEEINTLTDASPRHKAIVTASWQGEQWGGLIRGTHYGKVRRVFAFFPDGANTYGAELQIDAEVEFKPLPNLSLALGAANLLDQYPDRQDDNYNFAGNFPYDPIAPIGINGRYVYARAKVTF